MKRKLIILFLALTTSLSVFGGLASLLTTGPDSTETAPIVVAWGGPDGRGEGGSWGG